MTNAIEMLKHQHRQAEELFERIMGKGDGGQDRQRLFDELADALAIHATIEEKHFYPGVKMAETDALLHESVEEHLSVKRLIADLLELEPNDELFDAKMEVLAEQVKHHIEEEEGTLFPIVAKKMDEAQLEELAEQMTATAAELQDKEPRLDVPGETEEAAPI